MNYFFVEIDAVRTFSPQRGRDELSEKDGCEILIFQSYGVPVLFPFGHKLCYSVFEYKNLRLKAKGGEQEISYEIKNTSAWEGKEVPQVYVRECAPLAYHPKKELKAFAKTQVGAGKCDVAATTLLRTGASLSERSCFFGSKLRRKL